MTVREVLRAHTATHENASAEAKGEGGHASSVAPAATVAAGRAAQELGIRRAEFELAVHLGLIDVLGASGGGRPRVPEDEIARLREQPGFPDALVERVRTVGTAQGAALLDIAPARFTRLARAGCVSPVTFYLNRYRAVVWLYLADELAAFAAREPELLAGRTPPGMRMMLESGADWRARNWRSQRIDRLLDRTTDPWARTAVQASALDPVQLAEVVDDPYERAYLVRVRPEPVFGRPGSMAAREAMAELMLADDPDEILWRRVNLTLELDSAREDRPAPRPGDDGGAPATPPARPGARPRAVRTAPAAEPAAPLAPPARAGAPRSAAGGRTARRGLLARLGWRGRGAG
ncbi:hypothetical protein JHN55_19635 [Streptomyces sp. MBT56]|uniref:DUF6397 family protein n=1 Tax=unclassified Streptomyces TaxID=2593676 RepID=UPI00190A4AA3|nr:MULTISPECIES: DUF6397 family protein [unclassified Streptomyces]MBK3558696.1 hypothetical protein [Streptomyces sp. MBT56]MBK3600588.1 hypothetical protein [Streptomyces sp. MBT54]MBK3613100.1 hypothetical protein [Streptomyces sp. MBT98]